MPYYQYSNDPTSVIKQRVDIYISNLDNGNQTANYYYEVKNDQGSFTFGFDAGSDDLLPFNQAGYASNPSFAHPPVTTFFSLLSEIAIASISTLPTTLKVIYF